MPEDGVEAPIRPLFSGDSRFRPLDFVGQGGMGVVHRAYDRELGSVVALKTIEDRAGEQIYRLKNEFRALAGVVHPNLIQLHDLVVREDACYFTMEFVEGPDFVEYVRGASADPPQEALLRRFYEAAPQLVRGLAALHASGRLHRDVKPSNVRVDPNGRVVVLDFDLAAPIVEVGAPASEKMELLGTLAYMAPEQLWTLDVSQASDWYSVGVVFHEALTGRLPFSDASRSPAEGTATVTLSGWDLMLRDRFGDLVAALLHPEPTRRPGPDAILAALGGARTRGVRPRTGQRSEFVGREHELHELVRLLEHGDGLRIAGIHGPSGIGKSTMVRHLLGGIEEAGDAVVIAGQCHPQESVPYKALDPLVDGLSRHLLSLGEGDLRALMPDGAASIVRLFPVMGRVPMPWAPPQPPERDDSEARRRGVGAMRELLRRIARWKPLVVWIDDAQWSDFDSAALLGELLRPPGAPPLVLLLSYRSEPSDIALPRVGRELAADFSSVTFSEFRLEALDEAESLELARRLCPSEFTSRTGLETLAAESGGSPFFLSEMMWHLRTGVWSAAERSLPALRLGDVVSARLSELQEAERTLLELISLCGRPTERGLILQAARLGEGGRPLLQRLEGRGLVRSAPSAETSTVETYHDRIRAAVAGGLKPGQRTTHHRGLADAFEASGRAEPEVLAHHFHGSGQLTKASDYAVVAGDRAAEALAFVRAAELYRSAREWDARGAERNRSLLTREADSLAKGARLVDGGRLFLRGAEGAPALEGLELRRRGAEYLLSGGAFDDGFAALRALLRDLGLRYPRTPTLAFAAASARLLSVVVRGFEAHGHRESLDETERIRIDLCYGCGLALLNTDSARGIYFSLLSLARALRARDAHRTARSLCAVGGSLSVVGVGPLTRTGERMMATAGAIAERLGTAELRGTIDVGLGQVLMLSGRCREAVKLSDSGVRRLAEECQGYAFECNFGRATTLRALEELGRLHELGARAGELRDAAVAVGNRTAEIAGSQCLAIARIARGDVKEARELAVQGVGEWTARDFHMQHLYTARIQALCDLYEGRPDAGWRRLQELRSALKRSGLLRIPLTRIDILSLRGQLALASVLVDPTRGREQLRACEQAARRLEAEGRLDASLHACLLQAGLAARAGEARTAVRQLDRAIEIGTKGEMGLRTACARLRRAKLLGDAGASERARSEIRSCGVHSPDRWAALYASGFPAREDREAPSPRASTASLGPNGR